MKRAAMLASILLLAGMASAESCTVQSLAEQEAPRRVEITVLGNGKPVGKAKVELFQYKMTEANKWSPAQERTPRVTLFADARGELRSPKLAPGHYHVIASRGKNRSTDPYISQNDLAADLYLYVLPRSPEKKGMFTMQLIPRCNMTPSAPRHWSAVAEEMPIKYRIQTFSWTVYDPSGAAVPGASIKVIRKGTQGKGEVAEIKSDPEGHFAAPLPEGTYIGVFSSQDFGAIVPFEVTKDGSADFKVKLNFTVTVES